MGVKLSGDAVKPFVNTFTGTRRSGQHFINEGWQGFHSAPRCWRNSAASTRMARFVTRSPRRMILSTRRRVEPDAFENLKWDFMPTSLSLYAVREERGQTRRRRRDG